MSQPQMVSLQALANFLMVSERRVQQMAAKGIIPEPEVRGKYDFLGCTQGYIKFLQDAERNGESGSDSMVDSKERKMAAQADITEMKAGQMRGELVTVTEVADAWFEILTMFKTAMRALPSKLAPRVRMASTDGQAQQLMQQEISRVLQELSDAGIKVTPGTDGRSEPPAAGKPGAESSGATA